MSGYVLWLVSSILVGLIAAVIAKYKGRDPFLWFLIGAGLNVFVLLVAVGIRTGIRKRRTP